MSSSLQAAYDDVYKGKQPGRGDLTLDRWPRNRLEGCVVNAPPGERVLDVGCGNGRLLYNLRHKFDELCGIEFSEARVGIAAEALEGLNGDIRQGNIEGRLAWDDGLSREVEDEPRSVHARGHAVPVAAAPVH